MPTKSPAHKKIVKKVMKAKAKTKVMKRKAAPKMKITGRVIHFYDKICVAIVELAAPLKLGDTVMFKHGPQEWVQRVNSIQIEHAPVKAAKRKQIVGVKVDRPIRDGSLVMPA
ncbi:hypothetical protein HYZ99_00490 [Candidatus Peregrinibacteria bacterium]|nr:hypothetical protein [Candidatus Peregrinibacteria bacterium]